MGKIPKIRVGTCPASVLPRRIGMSSSRVNLQGEVEEVWMPLLGSTGSFATQGKEYCIPLPLIRP